MAEHSVTAVSAAALTKRERELLARRALQRAELMLERVTESYRSAETLQLALQNAGAPRARVAAAKARTIVLARECAAARNEVAVARETLAARRPRRPRR